MGSDFARFKSSITDQDGSNAAIQFGCASFIVHRASCMALCVWFFVQMAASSSCNLLCSVLNSAMFSALCELCSVWVVLREKMCHVIHFWLQCAVSQTWA